MEPGKPIGKENLPRPGEMRSPGNTVWSVVSVLKCFSASGSRHSARL